MFIVILSGRIGLGQPSSPRRGRTISLRLRIGGGFFKDWAQDLWYATVLAPFRADLTKGAKNLAWGGLYIPP